MRGRDLIGLALAALWLSKTRALLTLAGVALGAGMLVVSLSLAHGLRSLVADEFHKDDRLRRIIISRAWQPAPVDESAIPPAEVEVRGAMSEERRQRLRQYLVTRWRDRQPRRSVELTPDRLADIAATDHVEAVAPDVWEPVDVRGDGLPTRPANVVLLAAGHRGLEQRLVAGRLPDPARLEALVSETLLYEWGVVDDAAVQAFLGRPVTVTARADRGAGPYRLLDLIGVDTRGVSPDDLRQLADLAGQLPAVLERLDVPPAQVRLVRSLVEQFGVKMPKAGRLRQADATFTVVGVYYHAPRDDYDAWFGTDGDVVLSLDPARALLERLPRYAEHGYDRAVVTADREDHVRGVVQSLERLGYRTNSLVEWAERAYQEVTLIGLGLTVLSVLALVVAGLGITNTMVTSVLERTHDIGIMKAVGARDRDVLGMFLLEGAALGAAGGAVGLLGAWGVAASAEEWIRGVIEHQSQNKISHAVFLFPAWLVAGAPLFAMLVTTLAALLPARRAARIDPAVTLRTE